jgi:hypothetical protein
MLPPGQLTLRRGAVDVLASPQQLGRVDGAVAQRAREVSVVTASITGSVSVKSPVKGSRFTSGCGLRSSSLSAARPPGVQPGQPPGTPRGSWLFGPGARS